MSEIIDPRVAEMTFRKTRTIFYFVRLLKIEVRFINYKTYDVSLNLESDGKYNKGENVKYVEKYIVANIVVKVIYFISYITRYE